MDNAVLQTLMDTDHEVHTGKDQPVRVAMHSVLKTEIGEKKKTRLPNGKSCMEQAGGMASTGTMPILDIVPKGLHERSPIFLGSKDDVNDLIAVVKKHASA